MGVTGEWKEEAEGVEEKSVDKEFFLHDSLERWVFLNRQQHPLPLRSNKALALPGINVNTSTSCNKQMFYLHPPLKPWWKIQLLLRTLHTRLLSVHTVMCIRTGNAFSVTLSSCTAHTQENPKTQPICDDCRTSNSPKVARKTLCEPAITQTLRVR